MFRRRGVFSALITECPQLHQLAIALGHLIADDDLILSAFAHDPHHAGDGFDLCVVDAALVPQHKAKTGHAVGHAGHVFLAAQVIQDLFRRCSVIHK